MNKQFVKNDALTEIQYAVYYPDCTENLPLIVYLHGAGERGKNFDHIYRHALPRLLDEGKEYQAVILLMQCPAPFVWDSVVEKAKAVIDLVVEQFHIQKDRIALTGSSMGGYGTFQMGLTYRNFFSGIAPIAGGGIVWRAPALRGTPVYAIHGDKDETVLPCFSQYMVDKINAAGGHATLRLLEGFGHNDGINYAYEHTDVLDWLMAQRRTDFTYIPDVCENCF